MRAAAVAALALVGLARSAYGDIPQVPIGCVQGAPGVIGVPADALPASVQTYNLNDYKSVVPADIQDLAPGAAVTQADGITTLSFLKPLTGADGVTLTPDAPQTHIIAWGESNVLAHHEGRTRINLTLTGCTASLGAAPDAVDVPVGAGGGGGSAPLESTKPAVEPEEPTSAADGGGEDDSGDEAAGGDAAAGGAAGAAASASCTSIPGFDFSQSLNAKAKMYWSLVTVDGVDSVKMRVVYDGNGWVGWGTSPDGQMVGGTAIIAVPATGSVAEYDLNGERVAQVVAKDPSTYTFTSASITPTPTSTTLDFVRPLAGTAPGDFVLTPGTPQKILWAYGPPELAQHINYDNPAVDLGACAAGSTASGSSSGLSTAQTHGLLMTLAFVGLMPLAIAVARYGRRSKHWLALHALLQFCSVILVAVAFGIIVDYVGEDHFADTHGRVGLFLVCAVFLQVIVAVFRPHPPKPPSTPSVMASPPAPVADAGTTSSTAAVANGSAVKAEKGTRKSVLRWIWEIGHKVLGVGMVALGYYNIHEGLEYPESEVSSNLSDILIGVACGTAGLFLILEGMKFAKPTWFRPKPAAQSP
ncbi:hypothetical protein JKP88DRAFT_261529 [Tribonema minus]|uniref:Cytochrome b561 domain-containing protein n=1 Tax=Tribonema minus TaxID=303371 RepID=A0A835YJT7_9STRA|nr:hypothetical protein JKP88DRAFT_261529 [Tribonema minus]